MTNNPKLVDYFVRLIPDVASSPDDMELLSAIIVDLIPLQVCVNYLLEQGYLTVDEFSEGYVWYREGEEFVPMTMEDYYSWLNKQQ